MSKPAPDPTYDTFEAAWRALTGEQQQRFVDEWWTDLFHMCQIAIDNELGLSNE